MDSEENLNSDPCSDEKESREVLVGRGWRGWGGKEGAIYEVNGKRVLQLLIEVFFFFLFCSQLSSFVFRLSSQSPDYIDRQSTPHFKGKISVCSSPCPRKLLSPCPASLDYSTTGRVYQLERKITGHFAPGRFRYPQHTNALG